MKMIKYEPQYNSARKYSAKMMIPGIPIDEMGALDNYTVAMDASSLVAQKGGGSSSHRNFSRPMSANVSSNIKPANRSFQPPKKDPEPEADNLNRTAVVPNIVNLMRKIPRYIKRDKDDLYIEIQGLKSQLNDYVQDNTKLRTTNQQLEKEVAKLQVLIQSVEQFINVKSTQYSITKNDQKTSRLSMNENILTVSMKKQLKDTKDQAKQKDELIGKMKSDIKYTKVAEFGLGQVEIKESQIECMRLHTLLDQAMRNQAISQMSQDYNFMEEKFHFQMNMINSQKQEFEYLSGLYRFQEEETFKAENLLEDAKKVMRKQEEQNDDLKKSAIKEGQENVILNERLNNAQQINQSLIEKARKIDQNEIKIARLEEQQVELLKRISDRDLNIEYLDKTVNELKQKIQDKSHYEAKEKRNLQDDLTKTQTRFEDLDDRYKNLLLIQAQSKTKDTMHSVNARGQPTIQLTYKRGGTLTKGKDASSDSLFMKQLEYAPKKLRVVKTVDVQPIGAELNMRFQLRHITIVDVVDQYLFDNDNRTSGQVTIKEIHQRLKREPFILGDFDKAMLVARYLVEDNQSEFNDFDVEMAENLQRVKSIFTKLIGFYRIQTAEEEVKIKEEIVQVIQKYRGSLKSHFDSLPGVKGEITKQQILDTFIYMDIDLRPEVLDYFFMKLFALSNRVDRFSQQKIFEIFQIDPAKEDKPSNNIRKKQKEKEDKPNPFGNKQFISFNQKVL